MPQRKSLAKPENGRGKSGTLLLKFNLEEPDEAHAYEIAQQLARRPHGTRKRLLLAFFLGLEERSSWAAPVSAPVAPRSISIVEETHNDPVSILEDFDFSAF